MPPGFNEYVREVHQLASLDVAQDWQRYECWTPYRLPDTSRFKLIACSRERSWTNSLCFYRWVIFWLTSHGVTAQIVFTVDNRETFGGKSWLKVKLSRNTPLWRRLSSHPEPKTPS